MGDLGNRVPRAVEQRPVDSGAVRDANFARYVLPEVEMLLRVAMTLTAQPADAEDLVQDTLIRAYQAADCSRPFTVSMKVTFTMSGWRHVEPRQAGCRAGFRWLGCRGGGQSVAVSSAMAVRAADSSAMVLPAV